MWKDLRLIWDVIPELGYLGVSLLTGSGGSLRVTLQTRSLKILAHVDGRGGSSVCRPALSHRNYNRIPKQKILRRPLLPWLHLNCLKWGEN